MLGYARDGGFVTIDVVFSGNEAFFFLRRHP